MPSDQRHALSTERSPWLRGALRVPGDAVLTHLAMLVATVARGETVIAGALDSEATAAAERAVAALGAHAERAGTGLLRIHGLGVGGLLEPAAPLDFGGSALGVTLTMGLAGSHHFRSRFTADPDISSHSRSALLDGLRAFGCTVESSGPGRLPVTLYGPDLLVTTRIDLPAGAPATKAGLLMAALNGRMPSVLTEPEPSWNHAERMLRRFGARIDVAELESGGRRISAGGLPELRAQPVEVPADPSLAALAATAAAIVPGSEVTIDRVLLNPSRTAVLSAMMAMGADIAVHDPRRDGEEEIGDLVVRQAPLRPVALAAHHVAPLVADLPLLAVLAAFAQGESVFYLPAGLPLLEHARLAALAQAVAANGIRAEATEEAVVVHGRARVPGGARLDTDDPGIALAMLILGMGADRRVTLSDRSVIEVRFPGFVEAFEEIGAGFVS